MSTENWKNAISSKYPLYAETIEVSDLGNVRFKASKRNIPGKINTDGYDEVRIQDKNIFIHHLVAETWIQLRPDGMVIDHIDGNKSNNHYTNLRYITHNENLVKGNKPLNLENEEKIKLLEKIIEELIKDERICITTIERAIQLYGSHTIFQKFTNEKQKRELNDLNSIKCQQQILAFIQKRMRHVREYDDPPTYRAVWKNYKNWYMETKYTGKKITETELKVYLNEHYHLPSDNIIYIHHRLFYSDEEAEEFDKETII